MNDFSVDVYTLGNAIVYISPFLARDCYGVMEIVYSHWKLVIEFVR